MSSEEDLDELFEQVLSFRESEDLEFALVVDRALMLDVVTGEQLARFAGVQPFAIGLWRSGLGLPLSHVRCAIVEEIWSHLSAPLRKP